VVRAAGTGALHLKKDICVPVLTVVEIKSLEEAVFFCNAGERGFGVGLYSGIDAEQREFFNQAEAGTVFCNRRSGIPVGAWPGVHPLGGRAGFGMASGFVSQFMREQSLTLVVPARQ